MKNTDRFFHAPFIFQATSIAYLLDGLLAWERDATNGVV